LIWAEAEGCRVLDAEGREYLDLSGGFGVAALGHRNPKILAAWHEQRVVHALGDLAEAEVTAELRRRLPRPAKLGVTGEDAVEIALRTALLATGKPGILAFEGAYHGTGLLALAATSIDAFRLPFRTWLPGPVYRRRFGEDPGFTGSLRLRDRRAGAGARRRACALARLPPHPSPPLHRARRFADR
jgi:4-aminobutyrate aminotransferase-like enzyme